MDTEIELKLIINSEPKELTQQLAQSSLSASFVTQDTLYNAYYDTPDYQLRAMDVALRVRCSNTYQEQTIKTSGKVVGGLHSRPEYNIPIEDNQPELTAFPEHIWPKGTDVNSLQQQLDTLFVTNFERYQYEVINQQSKVELVYDQGKVKAQSSESKIQEVELELKQGEVTDLFEIAATLCQQLPCRLGSQSKAARGYALAKKKPLRYQSSIELVRHKKKSSLKEAFLAVINHSFQFWQLNEEVYASEGKVRALGAIVAAIKQVMATLELYQSALKIKQCNEILTRLQSLLLSLEFATEAVRLRELLSQKGVFRKKLEKTPELMTALKQLEKSQKVDDQAAQILWSTSYCQLKLMLCQMLVDASWVEESDTKKLKPFADNKQQASWERLTRSMHTNTTFSQADYFASAADIEQGLASGICFGSLYDEDERVAFRAPWLDILHGIEELKIITLLDKKLSQFELEEGDKLVDWCVAKQQRALEVMEQTRLAAISLPVYW